MTYIASNGELYDDEEIFAVVENLLEDIQVPNCFEDEIALSWERRLKL